MTHLPCLSENQNPKRVVWVREMKNMVVENKAMVFSISFFKYHCQSNNSKSFTSAPPKTGVHQLCEVTLMDQMLLSCQSGVHEGCHNTTT